MCLVRWCLNVVAFVVNVGLGAWTLTFNGEYKLISLIFFIPAATGLALALAPSGSRTACLASTVVTLLGAGKLIFTVLAAVLASEASKSSTLSSGLGVVVFTLIAILSGASAISDLVVGCSGYSKWIRHRRHTKLAELQLYGP